MKRDYIKEILLIKAREGKNARSYGLRQRLRALQAVVDHCKTHIDNNGLKGQEGVGHSNSDKEIHKYIPIGLVACMESYFRLVIKDLIDLGPPYSDNAAQFNKSRDIKFDFQAVQAIQGNTVTVGDFTAHLLPLNNLGDINSNISLLIGGDFLKKLKTSISEWVDEEELRTKGLEQMTSDIFRDVTRTFELRHIYCHELALYEEVDVETIYRCFDNTSIFLNAVDTFIEHIIDPNAPTCQAEMNEREYKRFQEVDQELKALCQQIYQNLNEKDRLKFQEMQDAWKKYRELKAEMAADVFEGGTAGFLVYNSELYSITKARLDDLKEEDELFG